MSPMVALAQWAPGRAILVTDTHACGLLTGSALALWLHRDGPVTLAQGRGPRRLQAAGPISALLMVGLGCFGSLDLVILPATAAAAALVASLVLVPAGSLVRAFAWSPMRWIVRRSYGIYLYHFPLAVAFVEERHRHGLHYGVTVTVSVAVSVLLAAAWYRWVETPFLRRKERLGTAPVPARGRAGGRCRSAGVHRRFTQPIRR